MKRRKKYTNPNLCLPYTQWSMVKLTLSRSLKIATFILRPCPTEKPIICEDLYTSETLSNFQRFSSVAPCLDWFYIDLFVCGERLSQQPSMSLIPNKGSAKEDSLPLKSGSSRDHRFLHGLPVFRYLWCEPSMRCGVRENPFLVCKLLFYPIASVLCFPGAFWFCEVSFTYCWY